MKRVFAFFLAVLMLSTNVGATISTHLCGGKSATTAISIGVLDLSCGMDRMAKSCGNSSSEKGLKSNGCCENSFFELAMEQDADSPKIESNVSVTQFLLAFNECFKHNYLSPRLERADYTNYIPPLLKHDITIMVQSFLI